MKKISLASLFSPVIHTFMRYHITIFIVFAVSGLGYAVFTFSNLLEASSTDSSYTSKIGAGSIDQTTLQRIKALHSSNEASPAIIAPSGRTNPFSE